MSMPKGLPFRRMGEPVTVNVGVGSLVTTPLSYLGMMSGERGGRIRRGMGGGVVVLNAACAKGSIIGSSGKVVVDVAPVRLA